MNHALWIAVNLIYQVECGGDPNVKWGDNHHAAGCMQIHKCVIQDVNKHYNTHYVWPDDPLKPETAKHITFLYLLKWGGISNSVENYCRTWNGGPRGAFRKATDGYWKKCKRTRDQTK